MAASYEVNVWHGAGPTDSAWSAGARYHRADTSPTTDGATTFIPIPTSGTNYSWRKHHKLKVTVAPTGVCSNLRWFTDGTSWGTGISFFARTNGTYTQGSSSDNSAQVSGTVDAVANYVAGTPLTVNAGTVLTATTGYGTQDYVVTQVGGGTTAGAGTTSARTLTYRVDET